MPTQVTWLRNREGGPLQAPALMRLTVPPWGLGAEGLSGEEEGGLTLGGPIWETQPSSSP